MDQLIEWVDSYIRAKNAVEKNLVDIKVLKDSVIAEYKDKKTTFLLAEKLREELIQDDVIIVCENRKQNVFFLLENWKKFCEKNLSLIFVNPTSSLDAKWIIRPALHDRICDENSLKQGLQAMFETVEEVA